MNPLIVCVLLFVAILATPVWGIYVSLQDLPLLPYVVANESKVVTTIPDVSGLTPDLIALLVLILGVVVVGVVYLNRTQGPAPTDEEEKSRREW